ncbi:MAG: hypothetical protein UV17_C0005G0063 [Candidatus Gottesmanbacteria bacterium GW2011_GWA1_42_26]|nr:MAG: hypothetical protein UV04_C0008G0021 [Candidatus Gottesmanbacteria bacterium GW2011_GWA2_42_16]KKS55954.1 MAG: hypothetical protein UV17_C0005G0063 [Candidatus Gottesmanbacteria bacterium GW2011_GWA1_42_26]
MNILSLSFKYNWIWRILKTVTAGIVFSIFLTVGFSDKAIAGYCGSQRPVDYYSCDVTLPTVCETNFHVQVNYSCHSDPSCVTDAGVCSSNDIPNCSWGQVCDPLGGCFDTCRFSEPCSQADCWVDTDPTPSPSPGGSSMWCGNCDNSTCIFGTPAECADVGDTDGDGACEGTCGGGNPTPTPTPAAASATITGRAYWDGNSANGFNGIKVGVKDSADNWWCSVTDINGNYSINFSTVSTYQFAVRAGAAATGCTNGSSYTTTTTGSESICASKHEACPYTSAENQSVGGFDFSVAGPGLIQGRRYDGCPVGTNTNVRITGNGIDETDVLDNNYIPSDAVTNAYSNNGGASLSRGNTYDVSFAPPVGYTAQYSYCQNRTDHPTCGAWTNGSGVNVAIPNTPAAGFYTSYVDLYFRCVANSSTINARAVAVDRFSNSCPLSSVTSLPGVTTFSLSGPTPITNGSLPSSISYTPFTNLLLGSYTYTGSTPPTGYTFIRSCVRDTNPPGTFCPPGIPGGCTNAILTSAGLDWDLGYTTYSGWFSTRGGSTHSNNSLSLKVPTNQYFLTSEEAGLNAGIVSYVTSADFGNLSPLPPNAFLAGKSGTTANIYPASYYDYYRSKFSNKTPLTGPVTWLTKPDTTGSSLTNPKVYDITGGNLLITGNTGWTINSGESLVVFVDSSLTLDLFVNQKILVTDGGFLAFITKGAISITQNPGYNPPLTVSQPTPNRFTHPNLAGVFISNSTFTTEGNVGIDNQLIAAGTYVAQSFLFKRDLNDYNSSHPGELFIYRPDLWRNAPRALKELPINWQEVAP